MLATPTDTGRGLLSLPIAPFITMLPNNIELRPVVLRHLPLARAIINRLGIYRVVSELLPPDPVPRPVCLWTLFPRRHNHQVPTHW